MALVTDLPVWDDCPWRLRVPAWLTIRRGQVDGFPDLVVLDTPGSRFHLELDAAREPSASSLQQAIDRLEQRLLRDEQTSPAELEEIRAIAIGKVKAGETLL